MKRMMMAAALAFSGAVAGGVAMPAQAATVVQETGSTRGTGIFQNGPVGQSFTMQGTSLLSFGFQFQTVNASIANAPLTFTLYDGSGFGGTALRQMVATLPASAARQSFWYDFALGGVSLIDGAVYTAAVSATTTRLSVVYGPAAKGNADGYAGGQLLTAGAPFDPQSNCNAGICDANFRFTADDVAGGAVPEPATWAMLVLGFGAIGYMLRRTHGTRATFVRQ